ncbi:uncharacterized protein LOC132718555 [Ruditapes philippinarum]|uniref:uncharacterized protein LOC132718555 n=1 Tax=Ruditapes philippinarum TaxID=129788 RepID=UPI00295BDC24|nr:uncharacterized protein LOC132718555 [Ruditapes philippinarum]
MLSTKLPTSFENGSFFHCAFSAEWISVLVYCDGIIDCLDASDETNCNRSLSGNVPCLHDQFQCGKGDCIHISQVCNFIPDCVDGSDEKCDLRECETTEFKCTNGQCIPANKRCDSRKDCYDGSDEFSCDACVQDEAFHCDGYRCIPNRLRCDKYTDCKDGGLSLNCEFGNITTGRVYTIVDNTDIVKGSFYNEVEGGGLDSSNLNRFAQKPGYICKQKIKQKCPLAYTAAAKFDDPYYAHRYIHCTCVILEVTVFKNKQKEMMCMNYSNYTEGAIQEIANNQSRIMFDYTEEYIYRKMAIKPGQSSNYITEYFPGPVVCEHDYRPKEDSVTCEGDVKDIPAHLKCLYDVDSNGIILGCRSGSHLDHCESFQCLPNTVKCPGSYCIPLRFICDGTAQCPGGQDEDNCGCSKEDSEILILYDAGLVQQKFDVDKFANHFYTNMSTIRILSYTTCQPLNVDYDIEDIVMSVKDTSFTPFASVYQLQTYYYKMLAKSFLKDIMFTQYKSGKQGIIFLENSEDAKAVSKQIFENISGEFTHNFTVYRVVENSQRSVKNVSNTYKGVVDVPIKRWESLNTIGVSLFPEICTDSTKVICPNAYRCAWSKNCISLEQVCDGYVHCYHGDDERLCSFRCPVKCRCSGYAMFCSHSNITMGDVYNMSDTARQLDLSRNVNLRKVLENSHLEFTSLAILNLSRCNIVNISTEAFHGLRNIFTFDLSFNDIRTLQSNVFHHLKHLRLLQLKGNSKLSSIEAGAFNKLTLIRELNLANAQLKVINAYSFAGLELDVIDLSNNTIVEIKEFAFRDLFVSKIDISGNKVTKFNKGIFTGVTGLAELHTPAYKFCCIRPNYLDEEQCLPTKDEFSSCEDLMRLSALQTMLWLIGLTALIGNALSIIYRLVYDRKRLRIGYGVFVTNLAGADLLMGIYLMIIATADALFRKRYIFMDDYWRNSVWCNVAGFLSTVSSEASVLFLCLITIDRLIMIKFPLKQIRITWKIAHLLSAVMWILSIFIAVIPFIFSGYFQDQFYTKSGVCIALPLTRDRPPGWVYSVAIFVGLNFITFVLVAFGQIAIFMEFKKTVIAHTANKARKQDLTIARNLLLVVTTDFLCWFPIGVMGIMALNGHEISGDVYAWAAVFILPVNSALNPILYTLSAIVGQKKFNPSTDEQNRTEISEYTGTRSLAIFGVSKHFSNRFLPNYRTLGDLLETNTDLSLMQILQIATRIAEVLDVVHETSLIIGKLDVDTIHVQMQNAKISGKIKLKVKPQMSVNAVDSFNDMLQFGKVLRILLASRHHKESTL